MDNNDIQKTKEIAEQFFKEAGFLVVIENKDAFEQEEGKDFFISLEIKSEEPKILIGQNGQTLFEIQHLLRNIVRKRIRKNIFLDIDINNYKKKKKEYLKEIALSSADEVFLTKKEKVLPPMSAYERRILHLTLSQRNDVKTESIGEGDERRVVIKPR